MTIEGRLAVDVERKLRTYVVIWRAAVAIVGQEGGLADPERSMAAGVLSAFSLEAYLNHVGAILFDCWDDLERLGWKAKLLLIGETLGVKINLGAAPFHALPDLFKFRDALAHGKTRSAKVQDLPLAPDFAHSDAALMELIEKAQLRWERQCEPATIRKWMEAVRAVVNEIHATLVRHPRAPRVEGFPFPEEPDDPFAKRSHGRATVKVARPRRRSK